MKAPLSWLRDYVAIDLPAEELAERLALTGTEVERVTRLGVCEGREHYVVGKVLTCERHPDADKLSVCTVDVGESAARTIVCGAPNIAAGQTVAVTLPGAVLPGGMRIKEAKLRGVPSSGMILSEAELGFEAKSAGTMVLPDDLRPGAPLAEHLPLSEWVLDIEVTPNRPDCLSVRGLAREIAAVTGAAFTDPVQAPFPVDERPASADIAIEVLAPDLCPRYAARVIRGVTIGESPAWLKARLTHAGMRPVNNVVDVTNYVMWTLGEPLHAFDLHRVAGRRIIVRRAHEGEVMTLIDGSTRTLTSEMLVIADAERPSAIAGVMGGMDSEVTEDTVDILLEAAIFHPGSIMRTEGALGLRSEASTRFEKGVDPHLVPPALDMACRLFVELCGGTVSAGTVDVWVGDEPRSSLVLRPRRVETILGKALAVGEMRDILTRLGCQVSSGSIAAGERELVVTVPSFRRDLEREIDLIEEVSRIHGLEELPSTLPARHVGRGGLDDGQRRAREVQDVCRGAGLDEVITYAFIDPGLTARLQLTPDDPRSAGLALANPLSQEQSVMRTMLLPGLLSTAARNLAVREERVHVFELGKIFQPDRGEGVLPAEPLTLGILLHGAWQPGSWSAQPVATDYYLAKGVIERVLSALGLDGSWTRAEEPFLHPGKGAVLTVAGRPVGWVGEVHPLVLRAWDLPGPAVAAELDADALITATGAVRLFEDLLTYPAVEQDLALVVDRDRPAALVVEEVRRVAGPLLTSVRIFDVYEGPQVGEGRKSLALRLTFRSPERTLSEAEVNEVRVQVVEELRRSIAAELRT